MYARWSEFSTVSDALSESVSLKEEWESMAVRHGLQLSPAFLAGAEESPRTIVTYHVATSTDSGGVFPVYYVADEANQEYRFDRHAGDRSARLYPTMAIGTRTGYRNALLVKEGHSHGERVRMVQELLTRIRGAAGREVRSISASFLDTASWQLLAEAEGQRGIDISRVTYMSLVDCTLDLDRFWRGGQEDAEEDYLNWLGSKRRRSVRASRPRFRDEYGEPLIGTLEEHREESARLLELHANELGLRPIDWRDFVDRTAAEFGNRARVALAVRQGEGQAVALTVSDSENTLVRSYASAGQLRAGEYFELGFRWPMLDTARRRGRRVQWGPGSYQPKMLRGARPVPLWTVILPIHNEDDERLLEPGSMQRSRAASEWRESYSRYVHPEVMDHANSLGSLPVAQ